MRFARSARGWLAGMAILIAVLRFPSASPAGPPPSKTKPPSFLGPAHSADSARPANRSPKSSSGSTNSGASTAKIAPSATASNSSKPKIRAREALLQVQTESQSPMIIANVVTRDLTGLRTLIGIDRGQADGLREGLPVLAAGGALVGVVVEARPNTSFVRLITDPDSVIRVLHQESRTESIANGDPLGNLYVQIPWTAQVELGHVFVTSGLDGLLPQGVPIGRAASTGGSIQDAFRQVRLQPLVPIDQIEQVLVQLSIPPPDLSDMTDPADATNQPTAAVSP